MEHKVDKLEYKVVGLNEDAVKSAVSLEGLTETELASWEESQRAQRKKYREELRRRGKL